jgi:hypothetical protein
MIESPAKTQQQATVAAGSAGVDRTATPLSPQSEIKHLEARIQQLKSGKTGMPPMPRSSDAGGEPGGTSSGTREDIHPWLLDQLRAMFEAQKLELNEPNLSFKDWYNQQQAAFNRGEPSLALALFQNRKPEPYTLDLTRAPRTAASADGLPQPKPLNTSDLKVLRDNKPALRIRVTQILEFIQRKHLKYPQDFCNFVTDPLAVAWCHAYLKDPSHQPFELKTFLDTFEKLLCTEVRPASSVAHKEIISGSIQQGDENVAQYCERFRYRVSALEPHTQLPPTTLCAFFLKGLRPEIREPCILDPERNEWSDLSRLMHFACGEEDFIRAKAGSRSDTQASHCRPKRQWYPPSESNKRQRSETVAVAMETEGTVAAAAGASKPPTRAAKPWKPEITKYEDGTTRTAIIPSSKTETKNGRCPAYGCRGAMSQLQKDQLMMWGICMYCRKSTEHTALKCPEKAAR